MGIKQEKLTFVILKVYSGCCVGYLKRVYNAGIILSSTSKEGKRNGLLKMQLVSPNIIILVVVIIIILMSVRIMCRTHFETLFQIHMIVVIFK